MNLNNLKPAWRHFRLLNSMQSIDKEDILLMIEQAEDMGISKMDQYLMNAIMFTVVTIFCQGG